MTPAEFLDNQARQAAMRTRWRSPDDAFDWWREQAIAWCAHAWAMEAERDRLNALLHPKEVAE